ncbi:MAG: hypothetical protein ABI779_02880 [Acidobacteriota bacterium]
MKHDLPIRICAVLALIAALALFGYSWYAFGAMNEQYLLSFHGHYLTFLALPVALAASAAALLVRRDSLAFKLLVALFTIAALFVSANLARLFAYMVRMSHGL